jgi:hypothetical protein
MKVVGHVGRPFVVQALACSSSGRTGERSDARGRPGRKGTSRPRLTPWSGMLRLFGAAGRRTVCSAIHVKTRTHWLAQAGRPVRERKSGDGLPLGPDALPVEPAATQPVAMRLHTGTIADAVPALGAVVARPRPLLASGFAWRSALGVAVSRWRGTDGRPRQSHALERPRPRDHLPSHAMPVRSTRDRSPPLPSGTGRSGCAKPMFGTVSSGRPLGPSSGVPGSTLKRELRIVLREASVPHGKCHGRAHALCVGGSRSRGVDSVPALPAAPGRV